MRGNSRATQKQDKSEQINSSRKNKLEETRIKQGSQRVIRYETKTILHHKVKEYSDAPTINMESRKIKARKREGNRQSKQPKMKDMY